MGCRRTDLRRGTVGTCQCDIRCDQSACSHGAVHARAGEGGAALVNFPGREYDEALAQAILAQAADAVIFADPDGVIRIWNAAAVRIFGFAAEEALGESLDLIIPDRLRSAHWTGFHRAMQSGTRRLEGRPTL